MVHFNVLLFFLLEKCDVQRTVQLLFNEIAIDFKTDDFIFVIALVHFAQVCALFTRWIKEVLKIPLKMEKFRIFCYSLLRRWFACPFIQAKFSQYVKYKRAFA